MGRPGVEVPSPSHPQPPFQPPQPPQPQAPNPSPYPPQNPPNNAACPPQPVPYPPQNPPNNAACPPQPVPYPPQNPPNNAACPPQPVPYPPQNPPNNAAYPPQPVPCPPNGPRPEFLNPTGYGPQSVSYPPPNPSTTVPQQYPPPPASAYRPLQHDGAAQGIPVQPQLQPAQVPQPSRPNAGTVPWSTGIFDCMDNPMNALVTACVPCVTFGQIAEIVEEDNESCCSFAMAYGVLAFFTGIPSLLSCYYRTKMRSKYGLEEDPAPDLITHFFCEWCALCQEYRELKARGLDPELGWDEAQKQQRQVAMAPPTHQGMTG